MSDLVKWLKRPMADRVMVVRALFWVGTVRLALSLLPYRTVERRFGPRLLVPAGRDPMEDLRQQERIVWAVSAAARRLLGNKPCLTQAIVARRMLARHGFDTELRIGVMKDDGANLRAHAWLERDGRVIIGGTSSPAQYSVLEPLEPAA